MRTWYRVRYNLPPNDPRYLSLTDADVQLEYWTIREHTRPAGETEFDTPDFDADLAAFLSGDLDEYAQVTNVVRDEFDSR